MGISSIKAWTCECDVCGDKYEGLAVEKSDFERILGEEGWKVARDGIRVFCPKCRTK